MTSVACSLLSLCVYLKQPKQTEVCTTPTVFRDQMNDTASLTDLAAVKAVKTANTAGGCSDPHKMCPSLSIMDLTLKPEKAGLESHHHHASGKSAKSKRTIPSINVVHIK